MWTPPFLASAVPAFEMVPQSVLPGVQDAPSEEVTAGFHEEQVSKDAISYSRDLLQRQKGFRC